MTIAQSVYLLATAICRTDSPSPSTALGSAPAISSSCIHINNLEIGTSKIKQYEMSMMTYLHALRLTMMGTDMGKGRTQAFSKPRIDTSRPAYKCTNTLRRASSQSKNYRRVFILV